MPLILDALDRCRLADKGACRSVTETQTRGRVERRCSFDAGRYAIGRSQTLISEVLNQLQE